MIVVKIEMWPGGNEREARELERLTITNTGEGTEQEGDYRVYLKCHRQAGSLHGRIQRWRRSSPVASLVWTALSQVSMGALDWYEQHGG